MMTDEERKQSDALMRMSIYALNLSIRLKNCLWEMGVKRIGDAVAFDPESLRRAYGAGDKTIAEFEEFIRLWELSGGGVDFVGFLSKRQTDVLMYRDEERLTFYEIGRRIGLSPERVRQIYAIARNRLAKAERFNSIDLPPKEDAAP